MTASLIVAALGVKAFYLLYIWLVSAWVASWLSNRKGYGEKWGLGTGLLLSAIGVLIWLVVPAKATSMVSQRKARKEHEEQEQAQGEPCGRRPALPQRVGQRLVEVGVLVGEPVGQGARGHGALAVGDDLGHVAVEQPDREGRGPARRRGGAARGRAPCRTPCWSRARARRR